MQGMPNKISDQDLYSTLLSEHKHMASTLANAVTESGQPALRQDFEQGLTSTLKHQHQIWQQMNQKGYYKPLQASQQQIDQVHQEVQKLHQQMPGHWQAQGQAQPQQTQGQLPPSWPTPNVT